MKKTLIWATAASLTLAACGTPSTTTAPSTGQTSGGSVLGSIIGAATNGETLGNIITSVIGLDKLKTKNIVGTWKYNGPGCAFTSDNALAKAGGEVAATEIESKLQTTYDKFGITSDNTVITFNENGTFSAKIHGRTLNGNWTFDESASMITMKTTLLNLNAYAKRNTTGISILFEATKLLTLMQTVAALSGNSTLQTVGDLSKNYDGLRIGFDMKQ